MTAPSARSALSDFLNARADWEDSREVEGQHWSEPALAIGHLRELDRLLGDVYIPGMVEVDRDTWLNSPADAATAVLSSKNQLRYFAAVQS